MKIAIRADASPRIGRGHIQRMLSLGQALRALGGEVRFVCRDLGTAIAPLVESGGAGVSMLPEPAAGWASRDDVFHAEWLGVDWEQDANETVAALRDWQPDWLIVDHYALDARWHDHVRSALGVQVAVKDDLADRALSADLVIDHNYDPDHRAKYTGRLTRKARLLGGPGYALLAPEYRDVRPEPRGAEVASIGVFMGGFDAVNASVDVLAALWAAGYRGSVEVASTGGNPHLAELETLLAAWPGGRLLLDQPSLAGFFARHDLHVGAGGGATWERACMGAPTLALAVAENQRAVLMAMEARGCLLAIDAPDTEKIASALARLIADASMRQAMGAAAAKLVDGRGAERVALAMMARELWLDPATADDSAMMFAWRNHPDTRAVSATHEEIAWEDHAGWLDRVLADPERKLFVARVGERPVGVLRLDYRVPDRAEVSLYTDPDLKGLGLGPGMLRQAEAEMPPGGFIEAQVLTGNIASERLFAGAGYRGDGPNRWIKGPLDQGGLSRKQE